MYVRSARWQSLKFESWRAGYSEVQIIHSILEELGLSICTFLIDGSCIYTVYRYGQSESFRIEFGGLSTRKWAHCQEIMMRHRMRYDTTSKYGWLCWLCDYPKKKKMLAVQLSHPAIPSNRSQRPLKWIDNRIIVDPMLNQGLVVCILYWEGMSLQPQKLVM
jgi:hypothetical protein